MAIAKTEYKNMSEFNELSKLFSEQIIDKHREKIGKAMMAIEAAVKPEEKAKLLKQLITKIKIIEKPYKLEPISDGDGTRILKIRIIKSSKKVYRGMGKPSNPSKIQWDEIKLTNRDYNVIHCFANNRDKIMQRADLIAEAWENPFRSPRVVDIAVSFINNAFECKNVIISDKGGYIMNSLLETEILNDTSVTINGVTAETTVYQDKATKSQIVIFDKVLVAEKALFLAISNDTKAYIAITPEEFTKTYEKVKQKK